MDFQTKQSIDQLAEQIIALQARVDAAERGAATPQLPNSSLTYGAIRVVGPDGTARGAIGFQNDGTFATVAYNGPPPPVPSDPIVAVGQLSLTITWNGLFALGDDGDPNTMPKDFDHVQVHLSDVDAFTPDDTTLYGTLRKQGSLVISPLLGETTYYTALVAVNTSGILSDPSGIALGTTDAVVADDIIDGIVTDAKLADEAVTRAKIAAAAVGPTQIADDSITTPKIVAGAVQTLQIDTGAVNADKIAAGSITTPALAALAVTADKIASNSITSGMITTGALDALDIHAGTLTLDAASGDLLVYGGTAALGNLFVAISPTGGVDAYGNGFSAGISVFNNGDIIGADFILMPSSGSMIGYRQ